MKLYTLTISVHIDDLETLKVHLDADLEIADPSMRSIVQSIIPAHLRKLADDTERQQS